MMMRNQNRILVERERIKDSKIKIRRIRQSFNFVVSKNCEFQAKIKVNQKDK